MSDKEESRIKNKDMSTENEESKVENLESSSPPDSTGGTRNHNARRSSNSPSHTEAMKSTPSSPSQNERKQTQMENNETPPKKDDIRGRRSTRLATKGNQEKSPTKSMTQSNIENFCTAPSQHKRKRATTKDQNHDESEQKNKAEPDEDKVHTSPTQCQTQSPSTPKTTIKPGEHGSNGEANDDSRRTLPQRRTRSSSRIKRKTADEKQSEIKQNNHNEKEKQTKKNITPDRNKRTRRSSAPPQLKETREEESKSSRQITRKSPRKKTTPDKHRVMTNDVNGKDKEKKSSEKRSISSTSKRKTSNETNGKIPGKKRRKLSPGEPYVPMQILSPGEKFVTQYGVVEVINDNRIPADYTPTVVQTLNKNESEALYRKKSKITDAFKRFYLNNCNKLRLSRKKNKKILREIYGFPPKDGKQISNEELNSNRFFYLDNSLHIVTCAPLDEEGRFTTRTVENITCAKEKMIAFKTVEDPRLPSSCYPDRIVECILIADKRDRHYLHDNEIIEGSNNPSLGHKMYLRRSLLTKKYYPKITVFPCRICNKVVDRQSMKHHIEKKVCLNKVVPLPMWVNPPKKIKVYKKRGRSEEQVKRERRRISDEVYAASRAAVEAANETDPRSSNILYKSKLATPKNSKAGLALSTTYSPLALDSIFSDKDSKTFRNKSLAVYPNVWESLDFKEKKKKKRPPWLQFDKELSAIYPSVYRVLNFRPNASKKRNSIMTPSSCKEPEETKKKRRTPAEVRLQKEQDRLEKEKKAEKIPPIVVDMMVLVEEIDTGRYPSIKRYQGEHSDMCFICKKTHGIIYCCEFCKNVSHLECLKERVTIRDPEPDDDFMCHHCIQKIMARRSRAEKRRLMKRDDVLGKAGINAILSMNGNNGLSTPNKPKQVKHLCANSSLAAIPNVESATIPTCLGDMSPGTLDDAELKTLRHDLGVSTCPIGGPGGLICCNFCAKSYSQSLADISNEMEIQAISMIGREVSEMIELLKDAQLRAEQAAELSRENDDRRLLLDED